MPDNPKSKFDIWFGNSKIVDEHGQALVVYHGTARDFKEFDHGRIGTNWGRIGADVFGFFFTTSPEEATHNALQSSKRGGHPKSMPVYLSLQNPLIVQARYNQCATNDYDSFKKEYRIQMIEGGHDGILVEGKEHKLIVALHSHQIKSAIGNSGLYSLESRDITDQIMTARKALSFLSSINSKINIPKV